MIRKLGLQIMNEAGADGGTGGTPTVTTPPPTVSIPENWHQALPEDLRSDATVQKYKSVPDLAKAHVHLQKQFGKDKLVIPDQFATKEDWDGVFSKLGRPAAVDGYQVKLPEGFSEEDAKWLKETALKNNMLPNQLEGLVNEYAQKTAAQTEAVMNQFAEQKAQVESALRKEWGVAYDKELAKVKATAKQLFEEDGIKMLDETGLSSDLHMIKALHKVANLMKEHNIVAPNPNGSTFDAMTPAAAQEEINKILGDTKHPYWQGSHPNHKKAVEHVQGLFKMVHQEG